MPEWLYIIVYISVLEWLSIILYNSVQEWLYILVYNSVAEWLYILVYNSVPEWLYIIVYIYSVLYYCTVVHKSMRIQRQNGKKRMANEFCTEGTPEMDTGALSYRKEV